MTNEELQQQIEQLEQQIKDLKIKLEEKAEKKPYEVEVLRDIHLYYTVNDCGEVFPLSIYTFQFREEFFKRGLAFKTEEEAEQFDKERILINKMKHWAKEHQGDWTPNWNNDDETIHEVQIDRFPMYACDSPLVINEVEEVRSVSIFPYFYKYETARKFIEEFGEEIEEVFC